MRASCSFIVSGLQRYKKNCNRIEVFQNLNKEKANTLRSQNRKKINDSFLFKSSCVEISYLFTSIDIKCFVFTFTQNGNCITCRQRLKAAQAFHKWDLLVQSSEVICWQFFLTLSINQYSFWAVNRKCVHFTTYTGAQVTRRVC